MKFIKIFLFSSLLLQFGCGSTSDPSTEGMSDLAVPQSLTSVTGDGKVTLWWTAQNAEDDFQGYYVFAREQTSSVAALAKYPANVDITLSGIPRCTDNSKFFEAFSANLASTKDCKGDTTSTSSKVSRTDGGSYLADSTTSSEVLTGWVNCDEDLTSDTLGKAYNPRISIETKTATLTPQKCTVSKIAGTALKNGTTYDFFVVSVKGSSRNKISWTSNMVSDVPSVSLVSSQTLTFSNSGTSAGVAKISFSATSTSATVTDGDATTCASLSDAPCSLGGTFPVVAVTTPTIYIGRDSTSGTYKQRFFISTNNNDTNGTVLQARGNQSYNPNDKTRSIRKPGDKAVTTFATAGTKFALYSNQIFDFKFTPSTGSSYYGKVYIESIDYSGTAVTDIAKVKVSVVLQPKVNETNYLH